MNDHAELHICFLVFIGNRLYSEQELAFRLPEVSKVATDRKVINPRALDGSLSIQYLGEELWPVDLWTEIDLLPISTTAILEGQEVHRGIDGLYASIRLKPVGEHLLYHLRSTSPCVEYEITRMLPLEVFIREWELMEIRMDKFIAYLRRKPLKSIDWYLKHTTPELQRIAGKERIRSVAAQDLVEMLSSSPCTQGYLCQEDQTFVKVPFGAPNPLYSA